MKKVLVLTAGMAVVIGLLTGCSGSESNFEAQNYISDELVNGICIDVSDREIEVSESGDGLVHIDYFENDEEYYTISVSDDGILNMTDGNGEGISRFFGVNASGEQNRILLKVPNDLLSSLEIRTTNEDISVDALSPADDVIFSNNNGDISFDGLTVGSSLQIENKNGDIDGSIIGSYDDFTIRAESKKGESSLPDSKDGGTKILDVSNNNGDIDIDFVNE